MLKFLAIQLRCNWQLDHQQVYLAHQYQAVEKEVASSFPQEHFVMKEQGNQLAGTGHG